MKSLSVIILTHNKRNYTRQCLAGLLQTQGVELEVIVVDNGSTDGTSGLLSEMKRRFEKQGAAFKSRLNGGNVGCSTARNQGLEMAGGQYCAFLDNDTIAVQPQWAEKLLDSLEAQGNAGLVGPKLVYPFEPHWIQCAGVGISRSGRVCFRGRGQPRDAPEFNRPRRVQCLISACLLFPRSLYLEIGGLDEAFNPVQFEDFDFCYRAKAAGYRCFYEPSVEMYHWESVTSDGTAVLPNTYLVIKHGMLFKKRWRHVFENEDGPADEDCKWRKITFPYPHGRRTV